MQQQYVDLIKNDIWNYLARYITSINNIFVANEIDCEEQNELQLPRNTRLKLESVKVMRNREKTYLLKMAII